MTEAMYVCSRSRLPVAPTTSYDYTTNRSSTRTRRSTVACSVVAGSPLASSTSRIPGVPQNKFFEASHVRSCHNRRSLKCACSVCVVVGLAYILGVCVRMVWVCMSSDTTVIPSIKSHKKQILDEDNFERDAGLLSSGAMVIWLATLRNSKRVWQPKRWGMGV